MSYIGNNPVTQSFISGTDYFNGTGSQTAFTLSRTVASINDIQVTVNNVVQQPNDAYTISGTTLTMTSAPSSGTNNVYVRYLSTTTQAITPSQGTVSWNTLDSNVQGDLGISFKNRIINGAMTIDQRNAGASFTPSTTNGGYSLDRWSGQVTQNSKLTIQQDAGAVTPPVGFTDYLGVTSSSAYSVLTGDTFYVQQIVEGFNCADLNWGTANAKTITISFWVRSSLTGTFGGALENGGQNRVYVFSYTISTANTWEQKSITITGDQSGTWATNNTYGIGVRFGLGSGSTFTGSAGSWSAGNLVQPTSSVSVVGTNGATWYLTGVQLEVGTQATTFTTAGGSYGAELALCQRYYQKIAPTTQFTDIAYGNCSTTTQATGGIYFRTSMRIAPSALETTGTAANYAVTHSGTNTTCSVVPSFGTSTTENINIDATVASGLTVGRGCALRSASGVTTAYLAWSAEL